MFWFVALSGASFSPEVRPVATTPTNSQPWPSPRATPNTWPTEAPAWPPTMSPYPTRKTYVPHPGLSVGAIIGIVVAAVALAVAVIVVTMVLVRRKRRLHLGSSSVMEEPLIESRKMI